MILFVPATKADLAMAIELTHALDAISGTTATPGPASMPDMIARAPEGELEPFDVNKPEDCKRMCDYLIALNRSASLQRVVMGMKFLLDPSTEIVDVTIDASKLERHMRLITAWPIGALKLASSRPAPAEGMAELPVRPTGRSPKRPG